MKIDDPSLSANDRKRILGRLRRHGELLRDRLKDAGDRAERFLLLTNAGGVVTIISFMGAQQELRRSPEAWNVLAAFAIGVVLCGILAAINFHTSDTLFQQWLVDSDRVLSAEQDVDLPVTSLNAAIRRTKILAPGIGWLAFLAFLIGLGLAFYHLRPHTRTAPLATPVQAAPRTQTAPQTTRPDSPVPMLPKGQKAQATATKPANAPH